MKYYTTSAQKTIKRSASHALQQLEDAINNTEGLVFEKTGNENIKESKMADGSTLVIASFAKENGQTIAMIDHKKVPAKMERATVQKKWRDTLDGIFT